MFKKLVFAGLFWLISIYPSLAWSDQSNLIDLVGGDWRDFEHNLPNLKLDANLETYQHNLYEILYFQEIKQTEADSKKNLQTMLGIPSSLLDRYYQKGEFSRQDPVLIDWCKDTFEI
nr:hypothetical protein [Candidatus Gracilibacteria bacterium]